MLVEALPAGPFGTNCWLVAPGPGEQCVVIDPGIGAAEPLDEAVERYRLHPVAVLLTHGHFDHTFAVLPVCQARGIPAYVTPADRGQLTDPWAGVAMPPGTPLFGRLTWAEPADVRPLSDGTVLRFAGMELCVEAAPGHTPGSVTFTAGDEFFSGDLLFAGSIGRVDFPGGSWAQMQESLTRVVLGKSDEIVVRPGHGPDTTIGRERVANPYLAELVS